MSLVPAMPNDRHLKTSPLRVSLQNVANGIDDPVYLFIDPARTRAATLGSLVLKIAAMPDEPFNATSQSSLSIYVPRDLLSLQDLRAIQLDPAAKENWTLALPSGDEDPLVLKPRRNLAITAEQPQTFTLTQVLATSGEPLQRRTITFEWQNFSGLEDDSRNCNATRELPPGDADVKANIEAKWGPRKEYYETADTVYVTPYPITPTKPGIANRLILRIGNKDDGPLQNNNSEFTITFPTTLNGDARDALCTPEQLSRVECTQVAPFQNKWRVDVVTDGETRHWLLRPPAGAATVFGQDTYVSFEFSNLVTQTLVRMPSAAVVSWSGIKSHKSGAVRAPVEKTDPIPAVIAFNARAGSREIATGDAVDFKQAITLDWRLFAADACRLDEGQEGFHSELTLAPGDTKVVYPSKPGTVYTLTPQITIGGSGLRGAPVDKQFRLNPPTAKLRVNPDRLAPSPSDTAETYPTKTTLHWECTSGDCFLSGPGLARREVERTGQLEVTAGVDQYLVESIGVTTATATARVTLPLPFIKFTVEPSSNGFFRLTWKSLYVKTIDISGPSGMGPSSRDLNGAMDFHITGAGAVWITATGAGSLSAHISLGEPAAFPTITALAYIGAQGPVFRWAVAAADRVYVECNGGRGKPPAPASGEVAMPKGTGRYSPPPSVELTVVNKINVIHNQLVILSLGMPWP